MTTIETAKKTGIVDETGRYVSSVEIGTVLYQRCDHLAHFNSRGIAKYVCVDYDKERDVSAWFKAKVMEFDHVSQEFCAIDHEGLLHGSICLAYFYETHEAAVEASLKLFREQLDDAMSRRSVNVPVTGVSHEA